MGPMTRGPDDEGEAAGMKLDLLYEIDVPRPEGPRESDANLRVTAP
jgi:hypothetical protein